MTPAQRQTITTCGGRRRSWGWLIMPLIAAAIASWAWAIHEIDQFERMVRRIEPGLIIVRPTPLILDDLDACHRRIDMIDATIVAIESRRGNEPPRTLAEQRAYRRECVGSECRPSVYATAAEQAMERE